MYILKQKIYNSQLIVVILLLINFILFLYQLINGLFFDLSFVPISILTLFYFLCIIMLYLKFPDFTHNLPVLIIVISYGIRMVIYPFFVMNSGLYIKNVNTYVYSNINQAVMLQCYELFCVILTIILKCRKRNDYREFNINYDKGYTNKIKKIIIFFSVILFLIILAYPNLLNKFRPIFFLDSNSFNQWQIKAYRVKNEMPIIIYHLSNWAINILRTAIVYFFVILIKEKSKKEDAKLSLLLSIFLIALLLITFTTDDQAGSLYISFAFVLLLARIYSNYKKLLLTSLPLIFVIFVLFVFFIFPLLRNNSYEVTGYASFRINAYFGGIVNISAALSMPKHNRLNYLLADALRSIPLIKGFFTNISTSTMLFNTTLGIDTKYNSQIIPCIGQGEFYLSFIGAPIFSIILVYLALVNYRKSQTATDSFGFFVYCTSSIFLSVGPIFYNFFLTFALLMEYILPLFVIYKLFRQKELNYRI